MSDPLVLNVRTLRRPAGSSPSAGRRFRCDWEAELHGSGIKVPCSLMDVSSAGACLRIDHVPPKATTLWLKIANIPAVPVAVAWQKKNRLGLRFLQEQAWVLETCEPRLETAGSGEKDRVRQRA